jgi:tetratricopeptide (TPR) repeat protein
LPKLHPPTLSVDNGAGNFLPAKENTTVQGSVTILAGGDQLSGKDMQDKAIEKINEGEFSSAIEPLTEVSKLRPNDSFVLQQLALSTYKSKQPSILESLKNAREILKKLKPESTNNPETLGLWGAVHKRMWDEYRNLQFLDESISAYERGFYLKQDNYNGINLSFLLNVRAVETLLTGKKDDAIADFVVANRIRKEVVRYTVPLIQGMKAVQTNDLIDDITKKRPEIKLYWKLAM